MLPFLALELYFRIKKERKLCLEAHAFNSSAPEAEVEESLELTARQGYMVRLCQREREKMGGGMLQVSCLPGLQKGGRQDGSQIKVLVAQGYKHVNPELSP